MKEILQYDDIWWRCMLFKCRGEIHSHAINCRKTMLQKLKSALENVNTDEIVYAEWLTK